MLPFMYPLIKSTVLIRYLYMDIYFSEMERIKSKLSIAYSLVEAITYTLNMEPETTVQSYTWFSAEIRVTEMNTTEVQRREDAIRAYSD